MMSQLDDIDWSALSHAYGSADDIPAHLRALSSPEQADAALDALYGSLCHQGTRSPASAAAAPFVIAQVEAGVQVAALTALLAHLVAGAPEVGRSGQWCDGVRIHHWDGTETLVADADQDLGRSTTPRLLARIWRAAVAMMPLWRVQLSHDDAAIRSATALLLSVLTTAEGVEALLRDRLSVEPDGAVRADLCNALRTLAPGVVASHLTDPAETCRFIAAACRPDVEAALPLLQLGLEGLEGLDAVRCATTSAIAIAAAALCLAPHDDLVDAVPALSQALLRTSGFDNVPLVSALLVAGFPEPIDASTHLSPLQQQILAALVATPHHWRIGNLIDVFAARNIPRDRSAVAAMIGAAVPEDDGLQCVEAGLTYFTMGFADQAIAQFDRVDWIPIFDQHPDGFVALVAYAQLLGQQAGRHEQGASLWGEIATRTAAPSKALTNQAIVLGRAHGAAAAAEALEAVVEAYPSAALAWYTLGVTLRQLDRLEDALAATDRAITLEDGHRDAWWSRASVLCRLGRLTDAVDAVARCLALDPSAGEALRADDDLEAIRTHPRLLALLP